MQGQGKFKQSSGGDYSIPVYLLFIFWPLLSLVLAFSKTSQKWGKNILWFFTAFSGYIFIFYGTSDSTRYKEKFLALTNENITFGNFYTFLSTDENTFIEVLQPLISLITVQFTHDFRVYYFILGVVFGYFYSRNVWYILNKVNKPIKRWSIILLAGFIFLYSFWDLNVFRFAAATLIFQRGLMPYLIEKNKRGLIWCFVAPFMHLTYVIPLSVLGLFVLIGNRRHLFFYIFLIGLFVGELDFATIRQNELFLPSAYQAKSDSYANEDYAEYRADLDEEKVWYYRIYKVELKWMAAAILMFLYVKTLTSSYLLDKYSFIIGFSCLFYGVFAILSNIPVMDRYLFVGALYIFAPAFLFFNEKGVIENNLLWIFLLFPFMLFFIALRLRTGIPFISYQLLVGNPVTCFFFFDELSILDVIK